MSKYTTGEIARALKKSDSKKELDFLLFPL